MHSLVLFSVCEKLPNMSDVKSTLYLVSVLENFNTIRVSWKLEYVGIPWTMYISKSWLWIGLAAFLSSKQVCLIFFAQFSNTTHPPIYQHIWLHRTGTSIRAFSMTPSTTKFFLARSLLFASLQNATDPQPKFRTVFLVNILTILDEIHWLYINVFFQSMA